MFEDLTSGPNPDAAGATSDGAELREWKEALRWEFEKWLASIDAIPEEAHEEETEHDPDLYSFYEQLAASSAEARKANRRIAEAFSQWGDTLSRFESQLEPLRESTARLVAAQPAKDQLPRAHCLILVELLDRMNRVAAAFRTSAPPRSWWAKDSSWRLAWDSQQQAFGIVLSHLEEWLKREGVIRLQALHQPFDPALMTAVAVEAQPQHPPQTVIEEIAPGYLRHGELLRPAQVKVNVAS